MNSGNHELPALKVSPNRRFLVTDDGAPFFWLGDTAWCLYQASPSEVDQYVADRAKKRFTVIQAMAIRTHGGLDNYRGDEPFTGLDPVELNEKYWEHIDHLVDRAGESGMYIALAAMWGHNANTLFPNPSRGNYEYGLALGRRYADRNHLIWMASGEYGKIRDDWARTKDEQLSAEDLELLRAIARGLTDGHRGRHLTTIHPIYSSSKHFHDDEWLDFNMEQTWLNYHACPARVTADYRKEPVKPAVNGEPGYEGMGRPDLDKETITPWIARLQAYWCLLSGAFGHTYGADGLWQLNRSPKKPTWQDAMAYEGGSHMQHARALMETAGFEKGVPDQSIVTSTVGVPREKTYVAALRAEDWSFALAYLPQGGRVTLDLSRAERNAPLRARWFDPRTGAYTEAGEARATADAAFSAPTSGERNDWVLVLRR